MCAGHLSMPDQPRYIVIRHRYVVGEETVAADGPKQGQDVRPGPTESATLPLPVIWA